MKLRCAHNSIRLRLRKSELDQLNRGFAVGESITFPGGQTLVFQLSTDPGISGMEAAWAGAVIDLRLPAKPARDWIETDQVGMESFLPLPNGEQLELLVEKDFPCKDRPGEDQSDLFTELSNKTPDHC